MLTRCGLLAGLLLSVALASGCRSIYAKGTPFYTGPLAGGESAAESGERLNVWPVVYYQEPNLSVVWPIFEITDDHFAIRPLFSIYKLDTPGREYNFIWPLVSWEVGPDGGRSLRVLFIPLMRKRGKPKVEPGPVPEREQPKVDASNPAPAAAGAPREPVRKLIDEADVLLRQGDRDGAVGKLREAVGAAKASGLEDLAVEANRRIYAINKAAVVDGK
jgi:hypothetical protein